MKIETTVGVLGSGPAGLMLSHLLAKRGIASHVIETRSRAYCEGRVRAGLLEQGSVDLLDAIDCGARLHREGLVHDGTWLRFGGRSHHVDFLGSTGRRVTIYGQQEIVRDLIAARLERVGQLEFEVSDVRIAEYDGEAPMIHYTDAHGERVDVACRYIAGCDGFHGIARPSIAPERITVIEHAYPFAWLGILAQAPPLTDELVYVHTDEGFALFTMRSPVLARNYLQVAVDETIENWSDERIWAEMHHRLRGEADVPHLTEGTILKKEVTAMRSFVAEPLRFGQLFLAGDAAHIVPPTGAKGMNLALGDVALLSTGIAEAEAGNTELLDAYSALALQRIWKAERFSYWMTSLMHVLPDASAFERRAQLAEMEYVASSRAAIESFSEQYVGLPYAIPFDRIAPWQHVAATS